MSGQERYVYDSFTQENSMWRKKVEDTLRRYTNWFDNVKDIANDDETQLFREYEHALSQLLNALVKISADVASKEFKDRNSTPPVSALERSACTMSKGLDSQTKGAFFPQSRTSQGETTQFVPSVTHRHIWKNAADLVKTVQDLLISVGVRSRSCSMFFKLRERAVAESQESSEIKTRMRTISALRKVERKAYHTVPYGPESQLQPLSGLFAIPSLTEEFNKSRKERHGNRNSAPGSELVSPTTIVDKLKEYTPSVLLGIVDLAMGKETSSCSTALATESTTGGTDYKSIVNNDTSMDAGSNGNQVETGANSNRADTGSQDSTTKMIETSQKVAADSSGQSSSSVQSSKEKNYHIVASTTTNTFPGRKKKKRKMWPMRDDEIALVLPEFELCLDSNIEDLEYYEDLFDDVERLLRSRTEGSGSSGMNDEKRDAFDEQSFALEHIYQRGENLANQRGVPPMSFLSYYSTSSEDVRNDCCTPPCRKIVRKICPDNANNKRFKKRPLTLAPIPLDTPSLTGVIGEMNNGSRKNSKGSTDGVKKTQIGGEDIQNAKDSEGSNSTVFSNADHSPADMLEMDTPVDTAVDTAVDSNNSAPGTVVRRIDPTCPHVIKWKKQVSDAIMSDFRRTCHWNSFNLANMTEITFIHNKIFPQPETEAEGSYTAGSNWGPSMLSVWASIKQNQLIKPDDTDFPETMNVEQLLLANAANGGGPTVVPSPSPTDSYLEGVLSTMVGSSTALSSSKDTSEVKSPLSVSNVEGRGMATILKITGSQTISVATKSNISMSRLLGRASLPYLLVDHMFLIGDSGENVNGVLSNANGSNVIGKLMLLKLNLLRERLRSHKSEISEMFRDMKNKRRCDVRELQDSLDNAISIQNMLGNEIRKCVRRYKLGKKYTPTP